MRNIKPKFCYFDIQSTFFRHATMAYLIHKYLFTLSKMRGMANLIKVANRG